MAAFILSPQSSVLPNTAAVIACFPVGLGIAGLLYPRATLKNISEFEGPTTPKEQKLTDNLIRFFGARDLNIGLSCLAVWYMGDRRALGCMMLFGSGMATIDGFLQMDQTGKGWEKHWPVVPIMIAVGAALLGWFDGFVTV